MATHENPHMYRPLTYVRVLNTHARFPQENGRLYVWLSTVTTPKLKFPCAKINSIGLGFLYNFLGIRTDYNVYFP